MNEHASQLTQVKSVLEERQNVIFQKEKQVEACKKMIESKQVLLNQFTNDVAQAKTKMT